MKGRNLKNIAGTPRPKTLQLSTVSCSKFFVAAPTKMASIPPRCLARAYCYDRRSCAGTPCGGPLQFISYSWDETQITLGLLRHLCHRANAMSLLCADSDRS